MVVFNASIPRLDTRFGSSIGDGFAKAGRIALDYGYSMSRDQNVKEGLAQRQAVMDQNVADKNMELGGYARAGASAYPELAKSTGYDPKNPNVFSQSSFGNAVKAQMQVDQSRPNLQLFEGASNYGTFNPKTGATGETNIPVYRKPVDPVYDNVETSDGVYMVNRANPSDKVRLGGHAQKGQYTSVNTGDGVWMVNTSNPSDRFRLGSYAPRADDPMLSLLRENQAYNLQSQMSERERKAKERYNENAPYDTNDFSNKENDYAFKYWSEHGFYPAVVDKPGLFTGDTFDGYNTQAKSTQPQQTVPSQPKQATGPYSQYPDGTTGTFNGKRGTIMNGYFIENGK